MSTQNNGVLAQIGKISAFLSKNIAVFIIVTSVIAFYNPQPFLGVTKYTAFLLGLAMFGMGLTIKREDFQIVFSRPKEVFSGCVMQYTVMPLVAYFLAIVMNLDKDIALGVILVGCCPGGTSSNVIAYIAKGDVPLSVGMTIASTLVAPLATPFLVYLLAGAWVEVSFMAMVMSVVKVVLVPVLAGIALNSMFPTIIKKLVNIMPAISVIAIVLIVDGIVAANAAKIMSCALVVMAAVILHNGLGIAIGQVLAKAMKVSYEKQTSIAIEVGTQNSGLGLVLATANFAANPLATLPGAIFSVWNLIAGSLYASYRNAGYETTADKENIKAKEATIH